VTEQDKLMKAKTKATAKPRPRAVPPSAPSPGIGGRIAFLRRQQAISLENLAQKSGLTKSFLSKLERGISVPSISTAMALAESLGLSVAQLMGEQQYDDAICIVRKGHRPSFMRRGSDVGYDYEMLAAGKRFKIMEPYIMRLPLMFQDKRRFEQAGQEFLFVLSGSMEIEFADKVFRLDAGDAVYFDSNIPHRSRSLKGRIAEALVVVTA
jgi:transcriptional regulator with XRE-family HTH domain